MEKIREKQTPRNGKINFRPQNNVKWNGKFESGMVRMEFPTSKQPLLKWMEGKQITLGAYAAFVGSTSKRVRHRRSETFPITDRETFKLHNHLSSTTALNRNIVAYSRKETRIYLNIQQQGPNESRMERVYGRSTNQLHY